jgi:hypothetical protein
MQAYRRRGTTPVILNLGPRWRGLVSFTPRPLYPWYPSNRMLGGCHSRSGRFGEKIKIRPLLKQEPWTAQYKTQAPNQLQYWSDTHCTFLQHDNLRGIQIFPKSTSHLKLLGVRKVTQDPQILGGAVRNLVARGDLQLTASTANAALRKNGR